MTQMLAGGRRTMLAAVALALLAPGALARAGAGVGPAIGGRVAAGLRRHLGALFDDPEAARSLGRSYLADYPDDTAGVRSWARELDAGCRRRGTAEGLRAALIEGRERDFRSASVVVVEGWVLARTEARVCALLVMLG